jgi:hypothetical protein
MSQASIKTADWNPSKNPLEVGGPRRPTLPRLPGFGAPSVQPTHAGGGYFEGGSFAIYDNGKDPRRVTIRTDAEGHIRGLTVLVNGSYAEVTRKMTSKEAKAQIDHLLATL